MAHEFKIPEKLVPKLWTKKVWREGLKASYFDKFTSTNGNNVVHTNKDQKQAKGDEVNFGLVMNLKGNGVSGNNTLKGNEEEMQMYDFSVKTTLVRNAVTRFEADDQKSPYENLPLIKGVLVQWLSDWKDNKLISALTANPTTGERLIASTAGTEVSLTANDKLTCAVIGRAKRKAKMHEPTVKPLKIDGQEKYIMLVGTWAARDLKADPVWQAAQQNAAIRGSKTRFSPEHSANMTASFFMNTNVFRIRKLVRLPQMLFTICFWDSKRHASLWLVKPDSLKMKTITAMYRGMVSRSSVALKNPSTTAKIMA